jgi:hypothetical protein
LTLFGDGEALETTNQVEVILLFSSSISFGDNDNYGNESESFIVTENSSLRHGVSIWCALMKDAKHTV